MREILFRGKRINNGEWEYGAYVRYGFTDKQKTYIVPRYASALYGFEVIPETLGQFTGLLDRNGNKIFDGDIIERRLLPTKRICTKSIVKYAEPHAAFAINDISGSVIEDYLDSILRMNFEIEVVGNIYDSPELMEAES